MHWFEKHSGSYEEKLHPSNGGQRMIIHHKSIEITIILNLKLSKFDQPIRNSNSLDIQINLFAATYDELYFQGLFSAVGLFLRS